MVQITKPVQAKHRETLSPYVEQFVTTASALPLQQLPIKLAEFPTRWPFPRGDLYHWIPLLNRFDSVLEAFSETYGLAEGPQMRHFTCELLDRDANVSKGHKEAGFADDGDRQAVQSILDFSRLLLENCGNRSIYASSPYLSALCNSTSLALVAAALAIGTQLAMRFQASFKRMSQTSRPATAALLANHYNIDLDRVLQLALPPSRTTYTTESIVPTTPATPGVKGKDKAYFNIPLSASKTSLATCHANNLVELVKGKPPANGSIDTVHGQDAWDEWVEARLFYYETTPHNPAPAHEFLAEPESSMNVTSQEPPATPTPVRRTSNLGHQSASRVHRASGSDEASSPVVHSDEPQSSSSLKSLYISKTEIRAFSIHDLLKKYLPTIPKDARYELLSKLRNAYAFGSSDEARKEILTVRVLAITNLCYIHTEQAFLEKVLKQDSEEPRRLQLVYQLAELLQPPSDGQAEVSRSIQTLALHGLEALGQYPSKFSDLTHALNTNVNHGILLYVIRKAVAEMTSTDIREEDGHSEKRTDDDAWRSAIFSLLTYVSNIPHAGSQLLSAGLFPILVEVLTLRNSIAERNYQKVFQFLDHIIQNVKDSFQLLVNADGLDALSDLMVFEVQSAAEAAKANNGLDVNYRNATTDYEIPFFQQSTIRVIFKFIHRMMSMIGGSGGNFDRLLRNLIDSGKFLGSLRQIMENGRVFGSTLWTNAVMILNDFINNEPTSFSVIAEAGLSRAFLESVTGTEIKMSDEMGNVPEPENINGGANSPTSDDQSVLSAFVDDSPHPPTREMLSTPREHPLARGIMASPEVLNIIPQTFGAICLNSSGMRMFQASDALKRFFEIFESPEHVQVMEADQNLTLNLGATFDELIRHHPPLKDAVINATIDMVARVAYLCNSDALSKRDGAQLFLSGRKPITTMQEMSEGKPKADADVEMGGVTGVSSLSEQSTHPKANSSAYINIVASYLSTVFSNSTLRNGFMDKGGIEMILNIAEASSLPANFADERSRETLHKVIGQLAEQKPHLVMPSLMKRAQAAADSLLPLVKHGRSTPYFEQYVVANPSVDCIDAATFEKDEKMVKAMINLQSLSTALRQCFAPPMYNHRATTTAYAQVNLADYWVELVSTLGPILGSSIAEDFNLQKAVPHVLKRSCKTKDHYGLSSPVNSSLDLHNLQDESSETVLEVPVLTEAERSSSQYKNYRILRSLFAKMAPTVAPLFQILGRSLLTNLSKRNFDPHVRRSANATADTLVSSVLGCLTPLSEESTTSNFYSLTVLMEVVKEMLVNVARHPERPYEINTLILQAFRRQGGFDITNKVLKIFTEEYRLFVTTIKEPNQKEKMEKLAGFLSTFNLATAGANNILSLYLWLVNGKPMAEAPQAAMMANRGIGERDLTTDYFSHGQLLVEVRFAILPVVRQLWESDIIEKGADKMANKLIEIIRTIAVADHEVGVFKRSDKPPPLPTNPQLKPWKQSPEHTANLSSYDKDLVTEALFRCQNNFPFSSEYCKVHKDPASDIAGGRNPPPASELELRQEEQVSLVNLLRGKSEETSGFTTPEGNSMVVDPPVEREGHMSPPSLLPTHLLNDDNNGETVDQPMADITSRPAEPLANGSGFESHETANAPNEDQSRNSPLDVSAKVRSSASITSHPKISTEQPITVTIEDLDEERQAVRNTLIARSLDVINAHGDVTFEISDLITTVVNKSPEPNVMRKEMGETLVIALTSFAMEDDVRPLGKKIAAYAHLLALMLQDKPFYLACVGELTSNLEILLGFVKLAPQHTSEESSPWIAHILLIIETLLSDDSQARETKWSYPTSDNEVVEAPVLVIGERVVTQDQCVMLLDAILDIMPRVNKDEALALAILRILVILTRDRSIAQSMGEKKNMQRLFVMAKQLAGVAHQRLQNPLLLILRHIIEDDETIKQILRAEIRSYFEASARQRPTTDVRSYISACSGLICRAPELFVEVSHEMIKLSRWSPSSAESPQRQLIQLKDEFAPNRRDIVLPAVQATEELSIDDIKPSTEGTSSETPAKSKTAEIKGPVVENPDGVIHFLLSELLLYRDVVDREPSAQSTEAKAEEAPSSSVHANNAPTTTSGSAPTTDNKDAKKPSKQEFKPEEHPIYVYRCFILQCLTELLHSYNRTKVEFINFKRNSLVQTMTPSKPRTSVLNYLLIDLIPHGSLENPDSVATRKRLTTSTWADSVITALLSKTGEQIMDKNHDFLEHDDEPDLYFVRKFVLENILKAYKEATQSTEALDSKYARILSLADLMSHVTVGKDKDVHHTAVDQALVKHSSYQLKRIMYEKGYIAALTASIADIDLNFPQAKRAVKYILRPLKALTHMAIDLSEEGKITVPPGSGDDEDEIASATSVSDMDDDREETPDLFRNSALGMTEPGRDHESSDSEDVDEEMYEGEFDDEEMDYDEEMVEDDDEDNISDEDEDLEGMGEIEGLSGDHPVGVEVLIDDDDDDDDDDSEDESDDDHSEDMDDMDEEVHDHGHVEIVDEEGNVLHGHEDDEGWDTDGDVEEDEEDYEGMAADEEEDMLMQEGVGGMSGPLNTILESLRTGDSPGAEEILRRIDADMLEEEEHEHDGGFDFDDGPDEMEEMDEEEDDEDDEDMDEEEAMAMYDDYPHMGGMPFGWEAGMEQPILVSHRGQVGIPGRGRNRPDRGTPNAFPFLSGHSDALSDFTRAAYRSHRPVSAQRPADEGVNPLLQRNVGNTGLGRDLPRPGLGQDQGSATLAVMRPDGLLDITRGGPFGESPAALLSLLNNQLIAPGSVTRHGQALTFSVTPGPGGTSRQLEALFGMAARPYDPRRRDTDHSPGNTAVFVPQKTSIRWLEEAKILFGSNHEEKAKRVLTAIMSGLVPEGIKAFGEAKRIEQEAIKKREEQDKLAKEKKAAEEKVAQEKKAAEEAQERARQEAAAIETAASVVAVNHTHDGPDTESEAMEGVEATEDPATSSPVVSEAPAANRQRVVVRLQDREVDITDLGIDPEFLQQIPDELREEVIASAIQERRSQTVAAGAQPSGIEQEFLDALPAEIRDEIIQQERLDRRRREREETRRQAAANGEGPAVLPQDMDAASILATMDPVLREQVLMEQEEEVLGLLPPAWAARASAQRRQDRSRVHNDPDGSRPRGEREDIIVPKPVRRSIVQMLDKPGIATLLRLMFVFQQGSLRTTLCQVLQNVSENRHNRGEVISTLLHILQDGSADMSAVERSFAHLSLRAKQPKEKDGGPKTPQPLKRTLTGGINVVTSSEISPLLVVQQCLATLVYLSQVNVHVPSFFLTEHENLGGLKRSLSRKGKGKDLKASKYAINSLLSLLDRALIMESASIMESLSDLLSRITSPLQNLDRKQKQEEEAKRIEAQQSSTTTNAPDVPTEDVSIDQPATMNTGGTSSSAPADLSEDFAAGNLPEGASSTENTKVVEQNTPEVKKARPFVPPVIPEGNLKLIINIFVARECGNKTFRDTLSTIKNLSCIPGAKDVFGHELIEKAQGLAETIVVDLEELLPQIQKAGNGTELQGVALGNFSPSGSDQNKLLKVLKALDHVFDSKSSRVVEASSEGNTEPSLEKQDLLLSLYDNPKFTQMWDKLSACLAAIRKREHMLNVATILLPLIESLMVVCKNTTLKETPKSMTGSQMLLGSPPPESRIESLFFEFTEDHRKILNDLVRTSPKLMTGSFSLLVKNPKVLEFDNKRNYFSRSMHDKDKPSRQNHAPLQFTVKRDQVFHDSYRSLGFKKGDELKYGKLSIRFAGEEGVDAGGVTREWFQVLTRQMFDPGYALFVPVSSDRTTFHPNQLSGINPEHLSFFKFIGRVIGKALYEGRVLDCHFSRAVYKSILGKSVSIKDLESLDPDYYKSVVWMMENDITDIITESFSIDDDEFGVVHTVDLMENGRNIPVTEDNKGDYIKLMVEHKLIGSVKEQLAEFLKGFHEIIPAEIISIFNEQELELLISGLPEIDVDDWKNNTELHQYSASSPQIQWFWRAMRSFDKEERAKMLQFVTGTSKVPLNGFQELEGMNGFSKFNIHRDYGSKDRLPTSHTCFNQLDLPEYESYETLRAQVLMAITAGSEYFGFA